MKRKYLNLDVFNGVVRFENIEFKKDDTKSYQKLFDYLSVFVSEMDLDEENIRERGYFLSRVSIVVNLIKSLSAHDFEESDINDKLLETFTRILMWFNEYIEDKIDERKFFKKIDSLIWSELVEIFRDHVSAIQVVSLLSFINVDHRMEVAQRVRLEEELKKVNEYYISSLTELKKYENSNKNKSSVAVYSKIENDFKTLESRYRIYFFTFVVLTLLFTVGYNPLIGIWDNIVGLGCSLSINISDHCSALNSQVLYPFNGNTLKYIIFKVAILLVGITLSTYFLKLTSFYQLRQEQAKQTKLELEAFPDFVSGMDKDVANNLREELALKYFGKDVDKTQIDKTGDLIQEQMKISTDLVKASVDMFKNIKTVNTNDETNKTKTATSTEAQ